MVGKIENFFDGIPVVVFENGVANWIRRIRNMEQEKLQEILNLKNEQEIINAIVKEGFVDMAKHPALKKVSLVPIAQSKNQITLDWIEDYKFSYQLNYIKEVEEQPNYEFIWLQINKLNMKLDMYTPHIQRVYAREKK